MSGDEYTASLEDERGQALWRAELADGSVVVMDDGRPGLEPRSAWLRLRARVLAGGPRVRRLWAGFRSNQHRGILPADADGYFFAKAVLGSPDEPETLSFFLLGALAGGVLTVQKWQVPEMVLVSVEERDPATAGECLLLNPPSPFAVLG